MKLDNIDMKVLDELEHDGRATVREISKKIHEPVTTVHNRLKKLSEEKVIKRFTIEPDYEKLGKQILTIVFASINHEKLTPGNSVELLKKQLRALPEIQKIYIVTGEIDMILLVRTASIKDLDEFLVRKLRNIKGIQKTTTQMVLEED